jgi:hypothetical protein
MNPDQPAQAQAVPAIEPSTQHDTSGQTSIFNGQIGPQDKAILLEFLRNNTTAIAARSYCSAQISIAHSFTPTKITLDVNVYADGITWDSSNHRFVITAPGKYLIIAMINFSSSGGTAVERHTMIYKNGSEVARNMAEGTLEIAALTVDIQNLTVGDYIELYGQQSDTLFIVSFDGSNSTYLAIAKL